MEERGGRRGGGGRDEGMEEGGGRRGEGEGGGTKGTRERQNLGRGGEGDEGRDEGRGTKMGKVAEDRSFRHRSPRIGVFDRSSPRRDSPRDPARTPPSVGGHFFPHRCSSQHRSSTQKDHNCCHAAVRVQLIKEYN